MQLAGGLLGGGGYAYLSLSNDFIPGKMQHQRYSLLIVVNKQFVRMKEVS